MEGILLEIYCFQQHILPMDVHTNISMKAAFQSFLSDNRKQDRETTDAHSKHTTEFLK